ncbi:hypothetical protein HYH03_009609 [Edaphochlamys debaryana]|uniref:Uncharacterized protein n=1 Tax=Edaphochlamys debaryana TaxID=47281 RepID=A0A836BYB1_9CHLO|nr:hypothetical protein HYH03_009609 [Edaphochlamys debaryana]|eukprot:KAG2492118.1 hypothetical protein HYH03_009609 [Edaphochlamys debaryana]
MLPTAHPTHHHRPILGASSPGRHHPPGSPSHTHGAHPHGRNPGLRVELPPADALEALDPASLPIPLAGDGAAEAAAEAPSGIRDDPPTEAEARAALPGAGGAPAAAGPSGSGGAEASGGLSLAGSAAAAAAQHESARGRQVRELGGSSDVIGGGPGAMPLGGDDI